MSHIENTTEALINTAKLPTQASISTHLGLIAILMAGILDYLDRKEKKENEADQVN